SQLLHSTPNNTSTSSLSSSSQSTLVESNSDLSSSSSREHQTSLIYPRVPNNTPNSGEGEDLVHKQKALDMQWIRMENYIPMDPRECHNEKERKRRLRIKNACQCMMSLLPCVTEKTDNATIFEHAAHFVAFMRETVGNESDMEFLNESCMY
ncbi:uncharacterized protein LOC118180339, partial [Stegodyphus dumicola]|uniref:uncharacterized protein LOC118180339 n=1 Tax=Stegodyphus dumicola TaxID=202533 RepID=UPI0015A89495